LNKERPILGITMGDPAGVGPEITAKAFGKKYIYDICRPLVVGDASVVGKAIKIVDAELQVRSISEVKQAKFQYGIMEVIDLKNVDISSLEYGKISGMAGNAAFEAVRKVIKLALDRQVDATVTNPINKKSINKAGYCFSGHTEIYAHFTNTKDYAMMLIEGDLKVAHVSTHVSLRQACNLVKKERVLTVIKLADEACRRFDIASPKVGVAALNPHSGEEGLFGWEEEREIIPAIKEAKTLGIYAEGPIPADTIFPKAKAGLYDIVVAMYHDQGHIPLKFMGFRWNKVNKKIKSVSGVNITLGLPIIRTSVDHGTAFEIAGKGAALEESLINAIEYGARLAKKVV